MSSNGGFNHDQPFARQRRDGANALCRGEKNNNPFATAREIAAMSSAKCAMPSRVRAAVRKFPGVQYP